MIFLGKIRESQYNVALHPKCIKLQKRLDLLFRLNITATTGMGPSEFIDNANIYNTATTPMDGMLQMHDLLHVFLQVELSM